MRLWILSDLHRDYKPWWPDAVPPADVCVVAGDVGEGLAKSLRWLQETIGRWMPVVFVAGNHEFYKGSIVEDFLEARALVDACPDVHPLEDESVVIDGVRFLGSTLWTDYEVMTGREHGDPALALTWAMKVAYDRLNDHRKIAEVKIPWTRFTPTHARHRHLRSRAFLERAFGEPHEGPTVVVTHHAPLRECIAPRYASDTLSAAYASDMSAEISRWAPALWIHGHMHDSVDLRHAGTRVVCNPRGYGSENSVGFDPQLVLEV